MSSLLWKKLVRRGRNLHTKRARANVEAWANDYLRKHQLDHLLRRARDLSESSGADLWDYYMLHEAIRLLKPQYVLECGTGLSTWIIAKALKEFSIPVHGEVRLVSMENYSHFHDKAVEILPDEFRDFVDIRLSAIERYNYSFVSGTIYADVPDLPYSFVFVDGPEQSGMCNMQFIKVLETAKAPVAAVVDKRLPTTYAYGCLLGKDKVHYNPVYELGIVAPVTSDDLLLKHAGQDWDGADAYWFPIDDVAHKTIGVGYGINNSIRAML